MSNQKRKIILEIKKVCIEVKKGQYECREVPHNMANKRMFWRTKSKWNNAWKSEVCVQVLAYRNQFGKLPLHMPSITVVLGHSHLFDIDGAYTAAKPVLDGIRIAGVIADDSLKYLRDYKVTQSTQFRGTIVEIEF